MGKPSGGDLAPSLPTTGAREASFQAHATPSKARHRPRRSPVSNQDRHTSSRQSFKLHRTAALAEWRGLCAGYVPSPCPGRDGLEFA